MNEMHIDLMNEWHRRNKNNNNKSNLWGFALVINIEVCKGFDEEIIMNGWISGYARR